MKALPRAFRLGQGLSKDALVVVGTEWCGFCKRAKPVLRDIEKGLGSVISVYWLDAEKHPKKAAAMGVDGYPTVFLNASDGKVYRYDGEITFDKLQNFLCTLRKDVCTRVL